MRPVVIPPCGLAFGVTTHSSIDSVPFMYSLESGTWMLDWQGRHNRKYVTIVNGIEEPHDFVSREKLTSLEPATIERLPQKNALLNWLQPKYKKKIPGDRVALRVTQKRELVFSINGEEKGVVATGIPEGVYGFVELMHTGVVVQLVQRCTLCIRGIKHVHSLTF